MRPLLISLLVFFTVNGFAQVDSTERPDYKAIAKKVLEGIRSDIISGKMTFANAAMQYSMDPGSATQGGLYRSIPRGTFVSEFEIVAYGIEVGKISEIFETQFGYHILLVEARRGNEIDVRHILITPRQ